MDLTSFKGGYKGVMMIILVVGPGCKNCKALFVNVQMALNRKHINATLEYVTDMEAIANTGIMRTPGLIIDGVVISQGKVLAPIEIESYLSK
jgi:small redox-active disulfide protein 2